MKTPSSSGTISVCAHESANTQASAARTRERNAPRIDHRAHARTVRNPISTAASRSLRRLACSGAATVRGAA